MTTTSPDATPAALVRYANLLGAEVHVVDRARGGYTWECSGCGDGDAYDANLHNIRGTANTHAGQCRALPRTEGA